MSDPWLWDELDRNHSILPEAHTWHIIGLRLEREPLDGTEPFLDLTLRRNRERVSLRFWSPRELQVERDGPSDTGGLVIEDVSGRGWELIGVRVSDFEASQGAVRFVARHVERL